MNDTTTRCPVVKESLTTQFNPCPFCGAKEEDSELDWDGSVEPSLSLHTWNHGDGHKTYVVQCARCGTSGPLNYAPENSIKDWNTRY